MDRTIAKTLTKEEKVIKKLTFSGRFINIMMVLAVVKWLLIFAVLSALLFIAVRYSDYAPNVDLSMIGLDLGSNNEVSLQDSLRSGLSIKDLASRAWILPMIIFFLIALPIVLFYYQYYLRVANRYVLTDNRIIFKRGWLSTEVESIHYDRITDVLVTQSIWDKFIFGVGKIFINTAGGEDYEAKLLHIKKPHNIKKAIYALKEEYRSKGPTNKNKERQEI